MSSRSPCRVNSHNEWDRLEELIIGSARGAQFPPPDSSVNNFFQPPSAEAARAIGGAIPSHIVEETEEDIAGMIKALEQFGVCVRRPADLPYEASIATPYWRTTGLSSLNARDGLIVIGNQIIESPMACRSRHLESWAFKDLLVEYFQSGAHWVAAPKPRLLDSTFITTDDGAVAIRDEEPIFDAANMFRCGRDIFFNKSNTGNDLGIAWMRRQLGEGYRIHVMSVSEDHIGTTLVPLRPGVLLANPARVNNGNLHPLLRRWKIICCPDLSPQSYGLAWPISSNWIGMNVLSIDKEHVLVEQRQHALIKALEKNGFTPVPVAYRHARTFGGGFHCISLDVRRRGQLEDYFE